MEVSIADRIKLVNDHPQQKIILRVFLIDDWLQILCLKSGIIKHMYNWSTDTKTLKKSPEEYAIWKLEQLINFGLNGEKIDTNQLKKYWNRLHLDSKRKQVLKFLLWGKVS